MGHINPSKVYGIAILRLYWKTWEGYGTHPVYEQILWEIWEGVFFLCGLESQYPRVLPGWWFRSSESAWVWSMHLGFDQIWQWIAPLTTAHWEWMGSQGNLQTAMFDDTRVATLKVRKIFDPHPQIPDMFIDFLEHRQIHRCFFAENLILWQGINYYKATAGPFGVGGAGDPEPSIRFEMGWNPPVPSFQSIP